MYGGGLEWKLTHLCFLLSLVDETVWRVHSYETLPIGFHLLPFKCALLVPK